MFPVFHIHVENVIYSISKSFLALHGATSEGYFRDPLGTSGMFCKTRYPEENCLWKININDQRNVKLALQAFKLQLYAMWSTPSSGSKKYIADVLWKFTKYKQTPNYFECTRCSQYEIISLINEQ